MSEPIKLLFDENFGEPLVSALAGVLAWYEEDSVEIRHLFRFARQGEKDENWIPRIAKGAWLVVSADKGKRCGGKKLPMLCRNHSVTHILLSSGLHQAKQFEKIRAIIAVWPRVIMAAKWTKGTRYSLRYDNAEKRVILKEWPTREDFSAQRSGAPLLGFDGKKIKPKHVPRKRSPKPEQPGQQVMWK